MHNRKLLGIIKYGKRIYKKKKLQGGGSIAVTTSQYDWRDDPYEKQLAQERLANQKMAAKKTTGGGGKKYSDTFSSLTGGFDGTRAIASQQFTGRQNEYRGMVQKKGIDWANSPEGHSAYQEVLDFGAELQERLKAEDKEMTALSTGAKDNLDTLAISGNSMFVFANEGGKKSYKEISVFDFNNNMSLADGDKSKAVYVPQTIGKFIDWKKRVDTSGDLTSVSRYLRDGSMNLTGYLKDNADPLLKSAQMTISKNGKTLIGASGKPINLDNLRTGLVDKINGGSGNLTEVSKTASNDNQIMNVVVELTDTLFNSSGDVNRLKDTLRAKVLSSTSVIERELQKIRGQYDTKKDRDIAFETYINKQMRIELVNSLMFKEKIKVTKETGGGDDKTKPNGDATTNRIVDYVMNGVGGEKFGYMKTVEGVTATFNTTSVVAKSFGELENIDKKPSVADNPTLNAMGDTSKIYLEDGTLVTGQEGLLKDARGGRKLIIAPGSDVDNVWIPEINGKPNAHYYNQPKFIKIKLDTRKAYINYTKAVNKGFKVKAEDLMAQNKADPDAYGDYVRWIASAGSVKDYTKQLKTLKGQDKIDMMVKLKSAKAAAKAVGKAESDLAGALGNDKVALVRYAKVMTIVNDDGDLDLEEKLQEVYGNMNIKASSADHTYMESTVNKIPGYEGIGDESNYFWADTNVVAPMYFKMRSGGGGTTNTMKENIKLQDVISDIDNYINQTTITKGNLNTRSVTRFVI